MLIKTSELAGRALDLAVAKALGAGFIKNPESQTWLVHLPSPLFGDQPRWSRGAPAYSTNPTHGQPIIESRKICTTYYESDEWGQPCERGWMAFIHDGRFSYGPTALIAAMRCLVQFEMGSEIEVPEELLS